MITIALIINDNGTGSLVTNSNHGQTVKHFKVSTEIKEVTRKVQVLAHEIGEDFEPSYKTWRELNEETLLFD